MPIAMLAAAIGAGASIYGANKSAAAAEKAAGIQAAASRDATKEYKRQYNQSRKDMMPWLEAGRQSLADIQSSLGSTYQESEGYKFQVKEGEKAALSNLAALGMTNSGSALKALTEYRMGLASQDYGDWYNRKAGIAGAGQTQSQALSNTGQRYAGMIGGSIQDEATARASGYVGQANALNSGIDNALGFLGQYSGGRALSPLNYGNMSMGMGGLY